MNLFVFEIDYSAEVFLSLLKTGQFDEEGSAAKEKSSDRKPSKPTRTVFADDDYFEPKDE